MPDQPPSAVSGLDVALSDLSRLRLFTGTPKEFWPRYLAILLQITQADKLILLARSTGQPWRRLLDWPADTPPSKMVTQFLTQLEAGANQVMVSGGVLLPLDPRTAGASGGYLLGARLELQQQEECVLAALVCEMGEAAARERFLRLRLAAATPEAYQGGLALRLAKTNLEKFAAVLDLVADVTAESRFLAMSMALCNGIATRFKCDRVSLGWLKGGFIRLKAVSHTEKFDRQMAAAQALESAMEETLDQDDEIVFPAPEGATVISKDHQRFAEDLKVPYLCSLPLRAGDRPVAVIFCERRTAAFTQVELQQMRLGADLIAARLADLQHRDLWFGARWNLAARERAARWLGPEHTWAKVVAVGMSALLLLLIFLRVPYRVEGNFTLRSEELSYLTAPFEGFIEQVLARPGDHVASNAPLVRLKTTELELEESFAAADLNRYQRETEKARAGRALADMRIAEAMAQEARARLETVRYRQSQATIRSPFAGVIVEGDLREHLGAPVKTAEVLLKVARIDTLYVEAEVNERDIHEVLGRSTGEIAFVSQPKLKFPVHIQTVEQAAMPKTEANVFLIRCAVQQAAPPWWRPGMSGVCKLDVEKRSLLWILTHRTIDFIRLKLWW